MVFRASIDENLNNDRDRWESLLPDFNFCSLAFWSLPLDAQICKWFFSFISALKFRTTYPNNSAWYGQQNYNQNKVLHPRIGLQLSNLQVWSLINPVVTFKSPVLGTFTLGRSANLGISNTLSVWYDILIVLLILIVSIRNITIVNLWWR